MLLITVESELTKLAFSKDNRLASTARLVARWAAELMVMSFVSPVEDTGNGEVNVSYTRLPQGALRCGHRVMKFWCKL